MLDAAKQGKRAGFDAVTRRRCDPRRGGASTPRPAAFRAERDESALVALRARVAHIEGRLEERLEEPGGRAGAERPALAFGVPELDGFLAGGLTKGLTELRLEETREAGTGAGFAIAIAILAGASARHPLVWIGERHVFAEAGFASAAGLRSFGFDPAAFLLVAPPRLEEAIWAGEEAARSGAPALVVLETRGNPKRLGLEGTRRLHVRAKESGRPLIVLRQAAVPETSAAPLRLRVSAHPGAPPPDLAPGRLLGAPAFRIGIEKSRDGRSRQFLVEWNPDEKRFSLLRSALSLPGPVPAEALHRPHPARATGTLVDLRRAS